MNLDLNLNVNATMGVAIGASSLDEGVDAVIER